MKFSCHTEKADKPQSHFIDSNNGPKPSDISNPLPEEGSRKTFGMVADVILEQAVIDIDYGYVWQSTPDIRALEDKISCLFFKF